MENGRTAPRLTIGYASTSSDMLSTPMRLMARPLRGYRELASADEPSLVIGLLRLMLVVGAFVSVTATGRFAPVEMLLAMFSFSWIPMAQAVGVAVTTRAFAPATPFRRAYALYLESLGPWLLVFLVLSGACLFAPQPASIVFALLGPAIVIATGWSLVLVFALFRAGLSLGRLRAVLATATFFVIIHVFVLGYYLAAGQLWPILR